MQLTKTIIKKSLVFVFTLTITSTAMGQNNDILGIGDPAPTLEYSKWLNGSPIKSFKKDQVYVLEFWATWCKPCINAIPHLSKMAKKYDKKTTFIGVNVMEMTNGKPYESVIPKIKKFVKDMGDKMSYNVIVDNNVHHMVKAWMSAAGKRMIPTTFVVKKGKIVWIGHPMALHFFLGSIVYGVFDEAAFNKKYYQ